MPIPFLVPAGMMAVRIGSRWVLKKIAKRIARKKVLSEKLGKKLKQKAKKQHKKNVSQDRRKEIKRLDKSISQSQKKLTSQKSSNTEKDINATEIRRLNESAQKLQRPGTFPVRGVPAVSKGVKKAADFVQSRPTKPSPKHTAIGEEFEKFMVKQVDKKRMKRLSRQTVRQESKKKDFEETRVRAQAEKGKRKRERKRRRN